MRGRARPSSTSSSLSRQDASGIDPLARHQLLAARRRDPGGGRRRRQRPGRARRYPGRLTAVSDGGIVVAGRDMHACTSASGWRPASPISRSTARRHRSIPGMSARRQSGPAGVRPAAALAPRLARARRRFGRNAHERRSPRSRSAATVRMHPPARSRAAISRRSSLPASSAAGRRFWSRCSRPGGSIRAPRGS